MSLFKIGAAYRTTPRTEMVFNFVYSESAADVVTVGTAGAADMPLNVDFDDYWYWGIEGGQRFFFTRVRFTPYAGYLVGLNRYGDIRGTFVDVPLNVDAGTRGPGRQVLREVVGVQPRPHRRHARRPRPLRTDVRDAAALHGWAVGRRLARRGGAARHQRARARAGRFPFSSAPGFASDRSPTTRRGTGVACCASCVGRQRQATVRRVDQRCRRALTDKPNRLTVPHPGRTWSSRPP